MELDRSALVRRGREGEAALLAVLQQDVQVLAGVEGDALATTLRRSAQFPGTMVKMIEVGEQSGQLEEMLQKVAENYEGEVDRQLTKFTAMLEPLMIVAMSMMVGFIVISILTPLMDLSLIHI